LSLIFLFITSLAGGGAEKVASELSEHLNPNTDRQIVTLIDNISYPFNKPPIILHLENRLPKYFKEAYFLFFGIIKYKSTIKRYKPDISMSFLVLDSFINVLSNLPSKKTKIVISVHTAFSMKFKDSASDKITRYLIKKLFVKAYKIVAVSEGVRVELINDFRIPADKIQVIYNPLDINKINGLVFEKIDEEWFNEEIPIIFNLGRLTYPKGQWYLLRSFAEVRKNFKCRLVILGDGDLKENLQNLTKKLHLTKDVLFLPWVENPYKYMAKSKIFVLSSLWEALPYALLEAMACGCPVIATDRKHGPREIIGENEYGILIPPMDGEYYHEDEPLTISEQKLADSLIYLLNNDSEINRLSMKGQTRALKFDVKNVIKQYDQLFMSILNNHYISK
jgi:glycosyltransferase involved in cell wall biosynthesis